MMCTRETDKHVILKLSITDGETYVSDGLGHVVGSGHKYINSQYLFPLDQ